jgi:hypothetical protein
VPLADEKMAFMRNHRFSYDYPDAYIVVCIPVDKLMKTWIASQRDDRSAGNWYVSKYTEAEKCLSESSCKKPVPMSEVGLIFDFEPGEYRLKLDNGITRIQWLVDHRAIFIPVICSKLEIPKLCKYVLLTEHPVILKYMKFIHFLYKHISPFIPVDKRETFKNILRKLY